MSDTLSVSNALSRSSLLEQIAHPTLVNPLAAQTSAATAAEQVWRVRQQQANQAAGEAYQGAIDAQGNFDPVKFRQNLVEKGPGAALAAGAGVTSAQELQGQQIDQASKVRGQIASMLAPLADPNLTPEQRHAGMLNVANQALDAGMPRQQVLSTLLHVPNDPAGQLAAIEQIRRSLMSPEQLQTTVHGKPITVDDGQTVAGGTQSQQTGALNIPPGQGVPTGFPTRAAGSELVDVSDGAGNHYRVPRSSLPGFAVSPNAGGASPLGTGRPPASLRNANAPQTAATPGAPAAPASPPGAPAAPASPPGAPAAPASPPGVPAAPASPPGVPAGATLSSISPSTEVENKGAAEHAVAARDAANSYQQRIQPIEGAIAALSGADTGKGGEVLNTIRAYSQDVAPAFIQRMLPNWATDKAARVQYEEANKYLTGMAINAPGGARSNAGQEAAGAATPSVHISNEAARLVARAVLAQQRLTQAGTLAFNESKQPAANYDRFMNAWNTQADPRAFVVDKMDKDERAAMIKSMGGVGSDAYLKFKKSYLDAVAAHVVPDHAAQ